MLGPRYVKDSIAYRWFCILQLSVIVSLRRLQVGSVVLKIFWAIGGDKLFFALKIFFPRTCAFLMWIDTELSSSRSCETILRARSCILFIRVLIFRLRKNQTSGKYPNWYLMKALIIRFLWLIFIYEEMRARVLRFWLALSHTFERCSWIFNL